ncbi:MAG: response regulator [Bosea sp.]|uniref:response regulator n=1 Tax=unclassified Bosea (in: a-proteobacteria) TaxID=2653178 RepID=UPI000961A965|nr:MULTISPECIES: response regulator [unclassified Bosea (in: a-proteobacteria)]MBN9442081.1 response regulator [Bosea sp. (in: a-proteobacteria)]MBN9457424.1 response regulator [Bosea sp. (in: a-proteobacteria)]OJV09600.1 MAG: DNA-binding response regulator [Bosea sp. 67-29]
MAELTSRSAHILVVDDDPRIRQMLTRYFEEEGYQVSAVADGRGMRDSLQRLAIDIVLLDLILPGGEDGLMLAREVRAKSNVPIIMLTGRDDVVDRIVGLEIGADDYIAKPFHLREVLARLRTVLRRNQPYPLEAMDAEDGRVIRFSGWRLDPQQRRLVAPEGADVPLTTGEFDILLVMARHPGRVFSRDTLMNLTRGRNYEAFDRAIDAQIARLRKKIEAGGHASPLIKSVRGVGYVFTGAAGARDGSGR